MKIPSFSSLRNSLKSTSVNESADLSDSPQHETVLDIGAEQLGKTYARAFLGAANAAGVADETIGQLNQIVDEYLAGSPALAEAFASPRVDVAEKCRVIDRLFGGQTHGTLVQTMKVMAERDRLGYLREFRDAVVKLHDESHGRVVAEVRSAVPLTDELRDQVQRQVSAAIGKEARLTSVVDESLIGGMVIRVGDTVFDSSVAGRIEKIGRAASEGFSRKLLQQAEKFSSES